MIGLRKHYSRPAHRCGNLLQLGCRQRWIAVLANRLYHMRGTPLAVCVTVGDPTSWCGAGAVGSPFDRRHWPRGWRRK